MKFEIPYRAICIKLVVQGYLGPGDLVWCSPEAQIYMFLAYSKSDQEDLTPWQLKLLKTLVQREFEL